MENDYIPLLFFPRNLGNWEKRLVFALFRTLGQFIYINMGGVSTPTPKKIQQNSWKKPNRYAFS